jgi:hypothetical protein
MIKIGDRVKEAIDHMDKGEIELALTPACIALDMTSQRYYAKNKSSNKDYKNFVKENLWLITYMGLPGILSNSLKLPFVHQDIKRSDNDGFCTVEDIIYHAIRCGLVHSDGVDPKIKWNNIISLGTDENGYLLLSSNLIWGLIGSIIFSDVNSGERIGDTYWIKIADFKYFINDAWGKSDIPQKVVKMYTGVTI